MVVVVEYGIGDHEGNVANLSHKSNEFNFAVPLGLNEQGERQKYTSRWTRIPVKKKPHNPPLIPRPSSFPRLVMTHSRNRLLHKPPNNRIHNRLIQTASFNIPRMSWKSLIASAACAIILFWSSHRSRKVLSSLIDTLARATQSWVKEDGLPCRWSPYSLWKYVDVGSESSKNWRRGWRWWWAGKLEWPLGWLGRFPDRGTSKARRTLKTPWQSLDKANVFKMMGWVVVSIEKTDNVDRRLVREGKWTDGKDVRYSQVILAPIAKAGTTLYP